MSEQRKRPRPPAGLQDRGRSFWRDVVAGFDLELDELQLLTEVCRLLDEIEALNAVLAADGFTVAGSAGQTRAHPALGEVRQHRLALGRLVAQLALPQTDGSSVRTPLQARGATGARNRWAGHVKVSELGGHHGA